MIYRILKENYITNFNCTNVIALCEFLVKENHDIDEAVFIKDEFIALRVKDFKDSNARCDLYNTLTELYSSSSFTVDLDGRELRIEKGNKDTGLCCKDYDWFIERLREQDFDELSAFSNVIKNMNKSSCVKSTECYLRNLLVEHYIYNVTANEIRAVFKHLEQYSALEGLDIAISKTDETEQLCKMTQRSVVLASLDINKKYIIDIDCGCRIRIKEQSPSGVARRSSAESFDWLMRQLSDKAHSEFLCFKETITRFEGSLVAESERYNSKTNNNSNEEETDMNKLFPELKCGKVNSDSIKMSHLGIAVKNKEGVFVAYDKTNKAITNVDIASIDGKSFLFQIPVQVSEIKVGDCIIHNNSYFCITCSSPLKGVNYYDGTEDVIQLTTNMFGFNFVTKIVSMLDLTTGGGNSNMNMMLPLLMLDKEEGSHSGSSNDMIKAMLMMSMMQQSTGQAQNGQMNMSNMFNNPMMLMALAGNDSDVSTLMMMSMMQQQTAITGNNNTSN